ncbi:MAG: hypothetical protein OEX19_00855 [Gammaproteobacteria bacterium]|nr:hypothetical protein [Gammaproteobacteria bacterium]
MKTGIVRLLPSFFLLALLVSACGLGAQNQDNLLPERVLATDQGKQAVTFTVEDNKAYMQGVMDSSITDSIRQLIQDHPLLDSIVMLDVPGTIDFRATLEASYLIREACLTTVVPDGAYIASGGVYFFLAGCERLAGENARIGVHTWRSYSLDEDENKHLVIAGIDLPPSDPAHEPYLKFHNDMQIPEEFYWLIVSTPFYEVYFLDTDDIIDYKLALIMDDEENDQFRSQVILTETD